MILDDALVFKTLFTGTYERQDVDILWEPSPLKLPETMMHEIEEHWEHLPKGHIFNGALARLDHWAATPVHCQFVLRPSDYRTLLFSNDNVEKIKQSWGFQYLSRALGISAVIVSSDNQNIFMKRSNKVGEFPNCIDVFGGHIDVGQNGEPCVFKAMAKELKEELNVDEGSYELYLIGLIETTVNKKPELVFFAKIDRPAKEIIKASEKAKDKLEFSKIYAILNDENSLHHYLLQHGREFSPSAYGSLCVYMQAMQLNAQEEKRGS